MDLRCSAQQMAKAFSLRERLTGRQGRVDLRTEDLHPYGAGRRCVCHPAHGGSRRAERKRGAALLGGCRSRLPTPWPRLPTGGGCTELTTKTSSRPGNPSLRAASTFHANRWSAPRRGPAMPSTSVTKMSSLWGLRTTACAPALRKAHGRRHPLVPKLRCRRGCRFRPHEHVEFVGVAPHRGDR